MSPSEPVWTNFAARGMWYQSVSARSMPPARLPSVGTIQPANTAAHPIIATTVATVPGCGAGGAAPELVLACSQPAAE